MVIQNPYQVSPLTAVIIFDTKEECAVRFTVKGKTEAADISGEVESAASHRIPVIGLYPAMENTVVLELLDKSGKVTDSQEITITTDELPDKLDDAVKPVKTSGESAFELTMVYGQRTTFPFAYDCMGDIRWYMSGEFTSGIYMLSNSRMIVASNEAFMPSQDKPQTTNLYEMDYLGRAYTMYYVAGGNHHEVIEKEPDGNLLVLTSSLEGHIEDKIQEIDRQTGEIVWQLNMAEIFDETYQNMMDWCHVNSAAYYEKDRTILISLRNVHAVICVDYDTKKLRWILSDPKFWEGTKMTPYLLQPEGDVKWCYQQHAAFEIALPDESNPQKKRIIVYDNHWAKRRKAKSFDKDPLSYVSFYDIDEEKKTVSLHKRFAGPKTRIRANGIYVPDKRRVYNMAGSYAEPVDGDGGGIFEYDYETGEVLSEFGVKPGFFRAYPFEPNVQELAEPMQMTGDYQVGQIKQPQEISSSKYCKLKSEKKHHIKSAAIEYEMQEDLLFVNNVDHEVEKVYFIGDKGGYQVDFDDTYQTMDVFRTMVYKVAMQLTNLPKDKYKIYLQVKGELQTTKKYIDISAVN